MTWSSPIPINKTPTTIPVVDQQAFLPTVAVSGDGTIAVSRSARSLREVFDGAWPAFLGPRSSCAESVTE